MAEESQKKKAKLEASEEEVTLYGKLRTHVTKKIDGDRISVTLNVEDGMEATTDYALYKINLIGGDASVDEDKKGSIVEWFFWDGCDSPENVGLYESQSKWKAFDEKNSATVEKKFQSWIQRGKPGRKICDFWVKDEKYEVIFNGVYLGQKNKYSKASKLVGRVIYKWMWASNEDGEEVSYEPYEQSTMKKLESAYRNSRVTENVVVMPTRVEYDVNVVTKYQVSMCGNFYKREVIRYSNTKIHPLARRRLCFDGKLFDLNTIAPAGISWGPENVENDVVVGGVALRPDISAFINYPPGYKVEVRGNLNDFKAYIHSVLKRLKTINENGEDPTDVIPFVQSESFILNHCIEECYMWYPCSMESEVLNEETVKRFTGQKCVKARLFFRFEDAAAATEIGKVILCRVNLGRIGTLN